MEGYFKDNKEFTLREVKAIHKNVSFRDPQMLGYEVILPSPKPEVAQLQQAIKDGTEIDVNGNRVRKWKVVDMFSDYTNEEGVVITKAEQEAEYLLKLKDQEIAGYKQEARRLIREVKDQEDDLTDTKIIVQWLAYAVVDIYNALTDEQKASMSYGTNIAMFASMLQDPNNKLRVDVEPNQLEKIQKIFMDELEFANIAKTEYLDKNAM